MSGHKGHAGVTNASARGRRNRRAGAKRELDVAAVLKDEGWTVAYKRRQDGEQGFDLLAIRPDAPPRLVEVKSGPRAFGSFPPADRRRLLEAADRAGGVAVLAHWPFNGAGRAALRWIFPDEWPETRRNA